MPNPSESKLRKKSKVENVNNKAESDDQQESSAQSETPSSSSSDRNSSSIDKPCHRAQDSLLSGSSGYTNYRGFFNLSLILLFLSNARVALENVIKYGILVDPVSIASVFILKPHKSPLIWLFGSINLYVLPCLYVERLLYEGRLSQQIGRVFYVVNATLVLTVPALLIFLFQPNPFAAAFCLGFHSVTFCKLISYGHVNYYYRTKKLSTSYSERKHAESALSKDLISTDISDKRVQYPDNLTVGDLYYFLFAPTLCYELNFPRNPRVRKLFVLKRLFEFLFMFQIILALNQQWIVPLLKNSMQPFISMDYGRILERLLKLAVPNHVIWLLSFYWMFHAFLNLLAELMRFADRQFYNDWWNAETAQYFWQNWNIPVHKWCVRHLYMPMVSSGYGRMTASCFVFIASAFFHEFLISIPLHLFRLWAFGGMLAQIPLNVLTTRYVKGRAGNILVWLSLILGQPLAILMYVHDWYVVHYISRNGGLVPPTANQTSSGSIY